MRRAAADRGVRIFTIGIGTPGGETMAFEGWRVRVRLDEETLKSIANVTRGQYFYAGNAKDLKKIYQALNTRFVMQKQETEVTAVFAGAAALLAVVFRNALAAVVQPDTLTHYNKTVRRILLTVLIMAVAAMSFAYGFYSAYTKNEVYRFVVNAKRAIQPRVGPFNEFDQLVRYPKNEVACPKQTDKTMVAVVFGQSNAANSGGQRYAGKPNVVNFFQGRCFEASDPLLGNDGIQGTVWTPMANLLSEHYDAVVLVPMAVGGTRICGVGGTARRHAHAQPVGGETERLHRDAFSLAAGLERRERDEAR